MRELRRLAGNASVSGAPRLDGRGRGRRFALISLLACGLLVGGTVFALAEPVHSAEAPDMAGARAEAQERVKAVSPSTFDGGVAGPPGTAPSNVPPKPTTPASAAVDLPQLPPVSVPVQTTEQQRKAVAVSAPQETAPAAEVPAPTRAVPAASPAPAQEGPPALSPGPTAVPPNSVASLRVEPPTGPPAAGAIGRSVATSSLSTPSIGGAEAPGPATRPIVSFGAPAGGEAVMGRPAARQTKTDQPFHPPGRTSVILLLEIGMMAVVLAVVLAGQVLLRRRAARSVVYRHPNGRPDGSRGVGPLVAS